MKKSSPQNEHEGNFYCSHKLHEKKILFFTQKGVEENKRWLSETHPSSAWFICCWTCCGLPFEETNCLRSNPLLPPFHEHMGPFSCSCAHNRKLLPVGDPHTTVPLPSNRQPDHWPEYTLSRFNHGNGCCHWVCCGELYDCNKVPVGICSKKRNLISNAKTIIQIARIIFNDTSYFMSVPLPIKQEILSYLNKYLTEKQFLFIIDYCKNKSTLFSSRINFHIEPFEEDIIYQKGFSTSIIESKFVFDNSLKMILNKRN